MHFHKKCQLNVDSSTKDGIILLKNYSFSEHEKAESVHFNDGNAIVIDI